MTTSQSTGMGLAEKLRALGLNMMVCHQIADSIAKSVRAEGAEHVVKRLKRLKQAMLRKIAGMPYSLEWIACNSNMVPKGPWGYVWRLAETGSYPNVNRALNSLMVYTHFLHSENVSPTKAQIEKFVSSVVQDGRSSAELIPTESRYDMPRRFRRATRVLRGMLRRRGWEPPRLSMGNEDLLVYLARYCGIDKEGTAKAQRWIERLLSNQEHITLFGNYHRVRDVMAHIPLFRQRWKFPAQLDEDDDEQWFPSYNMAGWNAFRPPETPVGVVGFTQEPGYKLRAFAAPHPFLQAALSPVKESLLKALRLLSWDGTHDQSVAVTNVQKWLQRGDTIYSVDLRDATNNFPLSLQLELLKSLGLHLEDRKLLWLVARAPYTCMWGKRENIKWTTGQPLGAGPSFMMFALAHALVALTAEIEAGLPHENLGSTFLILGDDFVTCHSGVNAKYRKILGDLGCPISEEKCITSPVTGEFAGKTIQAYRVFHGYKFRSPSDLSVMAVVQSMGPRALSRAFLTRAQYDYLKAVAAVPEPFGLGFNPNGLPYDVRWVMGLELQETLSALRVTEKTLERVLRMRMMYGIQNSAMFQTPRFGSRVTTQQRAIANEERFYVRGDNIETLSRGSIVAQTMKRGDPRQNMLSIWSDRLYSVVLPVLNRIKRRLGYRHDDSKIPDQSWPAEDESDSLE